MRTLSCYSTSEFSLPLIASKSFHFHGAHLKRPFQTLQRQTDCENNPRVTTADAASEDTSVARSQNAQSLGESYFSWPIACVAFDLEFGCLHPNTPTLSCPSQLLQSTCCKWLDAEVRRHHSSITADHRSSASAAAVALPMFFKIGVNTYSDTLSDRSNVA